MTLSVDFKVTPLLDTDYLRNGSYNGILVRTYTRPEILLTHLNKPTNTGCQNTRDLLYGGAKCVDNYTVSQKKVVHQTHGDNFVSS